MAHIHGGREREKKKTWSKVKFTLYDCIVWLNEEILRKCAAQFANMRDLNFYAQPELLHQKTTFWAAILFSLRVQERK